MRESAGTAAVAHGVLDVVGGLWPLLRLHQIRCDVDVTPYDWAWDVAGLVLLLTGVGPAVRAARRNRAGSAR
ncbi:DUF2243 domain-containing protein [Streptomyces sp. NPDC050388]|uniref:DUF2243 domain-containing protein n=1 Tax=Streptomyces sp. NPDC050388 TaxID=3155781 RepID=UPI0034158842